MTLPLDQPLNRLRARLAGGDICTSMVVRFSRSAEIAALARSAGFDSLYVDIEHAPLSIDQASQICIAAQALGVTPLVRIPEGRTDLIGRVLDGGAQGVIVPHITSAEDARAAVAGAMFPPQGRRSAAGPAVQLAYAPLPATEAGAVLNAGTIVAVMIESVEAVRAADEIAAVDGIDLLLVGANDLLGDLGFPGEYDRPELGEAFAAVLAAGARHDTAVGVGGLAARPDLMRRYLAAGARYVSVGTDTAFLAAGARTARAAALAQDS